MTVKLTPTAQTDLDQLIEYLEHTWSNQVVQNFLSKLTKVITLLKTNPKLGRRSAKRPEYRRYSISKHTFFYYQLDLEHQIIYILSFEDNRKSTN